MCGCKCKWGADSHADFFRNVKFFFWNVISSLEMIFSLGMLKLIRCVMTFIGMLFVRLVVKSLNRPVRPENLKRPETNKHNIMNKLKEMQNI